MTYKIIEVAENNVELWETKETKTDVDGNSFDVWEIVQSYGIEGATKELQELENQIEELNPIKAQDKIATLQAKKAVVLNIKTILEK